MAFTLSPEAAQEGYRLVSFEEIGSTNQEALSRARDEDPGQLWLVTARQTAGRGRRGRNWETPYGNLAATLLLVDCCEIRHAATLGFVAGLALSDALLRVLPDSRLAVAADGAGAGRSRFALKWPNDVLAQGAKLAGILLESTMLPDGRFAVAAGIGVNVATAPEGLPYPATSISRLGGDVDAAGLFEELSRAWLPTMRLWDRGRGLKAIRDRWLERAAGLGAEVAVRLDGEVRRGIFETIDDECRFVLRDGSGNRITIAAGEVHFGAVATTGAA